MSGPHGFSEVSSWSQKAKEFKLLGLLQHLTCAPLRTSAALGTGCPEEVGKAFFHLGSLKGHVLLSARAPTSSDCFQRLIPDKSAHDGVSITGVGRCCSPSPLGSGCCCCLGLFTQSLSAAQLVWPLAMGAGHTEAKPKATSTGEDAERKQLPLAGGEIHQYGCCGTQWGAASEWQTVAGVAAY